ncbi:MAG: alkaline phosphatase [Clostridiaceae bacterium BRH_c20a]|nr:MAG: alkaline phosphatase [Clostridiaceae bacterium BRH_c20a]
MAELNLKQITDKLNTEFSGDTRKLVFWYDDKAEFADDIDTLKLVGAKVYRLEPDNQFYTKYFLERLDRETSYLIYAPFPKPPVRDNHLADTLLYSKQFFATRAELIASDLLLDDKNKAVIQKYIKFFGAKERTQKFYDLEIENFTSESIEIAIMSVLCKTRTASFEEVLRVVMTEDGFDDNKFLTEFRKYDLLSAFWRMCEEQYGYTDVKPTLEKFMMTMFVTYTDRYVPGELPKAWRSFISYKSGNIISFMDNLMNNILYRERYDEISNMIASSLKVTAEFDGHSPEFLIDCDTFAVIDNIIHSWLTERLLNEDTGAKLNGLNIPSICQERCKKHFGLQVQGQYNMLSSAFYIICAANYTCPDDMESIIKQYGSKDFLIDGYYRAFYYDYDQLADTTQYEKLRDLVENIYTNEYLAKVVPKWNAAFSSDKVMTDLLLQRNFFNSFIRRSRDKVVVIISDALRYETGYSLYQKLQDDVKCTVKLDAMMSVLPSYTRLGMAALLPHKMLEMTDDFKVLVDGMSCDDLKQRETILQSYVPNSRCVQFDDIKTMKQAQLREIFTGKEVVYIYHNQIDARGDKQNTENEVFNACEEAINEIYNLIKRLSGTANTYHFIVTADHGFIYKRDKLNESDKIGGVTGKGAFINRRFIVSDKSIQDDGVANTSLGLILGNDDGKVVSYPVSSNVFKVPGGGQNYVHGGSSPQEMIVPVIDIKTEKGHMETRPAQIMLVSMVQKVTNLIVTLDFIQSEPVSDVVKSTSYKLFFISENNEKISNECIYVADKKDTEPQKRIFRLRFNFKNKKYDKSKQYYLVAYDEKNDLEILRHCVAIDIAFANDFGFNV